MVLFERWRLQRQLHWLSALFRTRSPRVPNRNEQGEQERDTRLQLHIAQWSRSKELHQQKDHARHAHSNRVRLHGHIQLVHWPHARHVRLHEVGHKNHSSPRHISYTNGFVLFGYKRILFLDIRAHQRAAV